MIKNNVKCQCHLKIILMHVYEKVDISNNVCGYELNQLYNEKVIGGNKSLTQIDYDTGR